ncbi:hypothetical protein C8J56DRAFT_1054101 [Mycena floridula]|nr:hypothetical protein C8J56DRAFT_1054101 [Mycena floridula]
MPNLKLIKTGNINQQPLNLAICASLGYGSYSISAMIAIYVLIRRGGLCKSRARRILLGFIVIMLLSTTACFIADMGMSILQYKILMATAQISSASTATRWWKRCAIVYSIVMHIMLLMGDMIVVWRAWVLCDRRAIQVVLSCCILGSVAANIAHPAKLIESFGDGAYIPATVALGPHQRLATKHGELCRISVRKYLSNISQVTRAEKVLLLLIESGFVYLAIWIFVVTLLLIPSAITLYWYSITFAPYFLAMNPVIIILLVVRRDAPCETAFRGVASSPTSSRDFLHRDGDDSTSTPIINIGFYEVFSGTAKTEAPVSPVTDPL